MTTDLHEFLARQLGTEASATIRISDIEKIAGTEWLLEVCLQAQRLHARVNPHPKDVSLAVIERELGA